MKHITILLAALVASQSCNATISYDELLSGDLPSLGGITNFAFPTGENTVSGTATAGTHPDSDVFTFEVPDQKSYTISLVANFLSPSSGRPGVVDLQINRLANAAACQIACIALYEPVASSAFRTNFEEGALFSDPPTPVSFADHPRLLAGFYRLSITGANMSFDPQYQGILDSNERLAYRLSVVSVPVPLGNPSLFLGFGAAVLVSFSRRKA